jgi:hypothetical protein
MSTRCQVAFYNEDATSKRKFDALLYFHHDGYPEGMLPHLLPFLIAFDMKRGLNDVEYAAAWCIWWMIKDRGYVDNNTTLEDMDCLSHGICKSFHSDIEYLYLVKKGRLQVQSYNGRVVFDFDLSKITIKEAQIMDYTEPIIHFRKETPFFD